MEETDTYPRRWHVGTSFIMFHETHYVMAGQTPTVEEAKLSIWTQSLCDCFIILEGPHDHMIEIAKYMPVKPDLKDQLPITSPSFPCTCTEKIKTTKLQNIYRL